MPDEKKKLLDMIDKSGDVVTPKQGESK